MREEDQANNLSALLTIATPFKLAALVAKRQCNKVNGSIGSVAQDCHSYVTLFCVSRFFFCWELACSGCTCIHSLFGPSSALCARQASNDKAILCFSPVVSKQAVTTSVRRQPYSYCLPRLSRCIVGHQHRSHSVALLHVR